MSNIDNVKSKTYSFKRKPIDSQTNELDIIKN